MKLKINISNIRVSDLTTLSYDSVITSQNDKVYLEVV